MVKNQLDNNDLMARREPGGMWATQNTVETDNLQSFAEPRYLVSTIK